MQPLRDKIIQNSEPVTESGCWIWSKSRSTNGYGDFRMNGKHYTAHRASYEAFIGAIPAGQHVCHVCDVRLCCNPYHLFLGTNEDNIRDSMTKGRRKGITRNRPSGLIYQYTDKKPGPKRKLSEEQWMQMIHEYRTGYFSKNALARKYGLSSGSVCRVGGYLHNI